MRSGGEIGRSYLDDYASVRLVALNWFRDDNGADQSMREGISIGGVLSPVLWQGFSSILGYSKRYIDAVERGEDVMLPSDASPLRRFVVESLRVPFREGPPSLIPHVDEQHLTMETNYVPFLASTARVSQFLFRPVLRRRTNLYISDWSTAKWARQDPNGLVLYRRAPWSSAIPYSLRRDRSNAEQILPETLEEVEFQDGFDRCLDRHQIDWVEQVKSMMREYACRVYVRVRSLLVEQAARWINMIDFYRPTMVYLPADAIESWNLLYYLCHREGIRTTMCVDGYMVMPFYPMLRSADGSDWLTSRFLAYGQAQARMIERYGFPIERIDIDHPPFLLLQAELPNNQNVEFGAIVMTWTPLVVNPQSDFDSPASTLAAALRALTNSGIQQIAIKVRTEFERPYVERVLDEMGLSATIIEGRLYQHIRRSRLFVGGLSTALAEVAASGAQYIVFEPDSNGHPDELIAQSEVVSCASIVRTEADLLSAIESGMTSWIGDVRETLLEQ